MITLEEFSEAYSSTMLPVAISYLYEIVEINDKRIEDEGLKIYQNLTKSDDDSFTMILWVGKEKGDDGNLAAGGLFRKRYFLSAIKIGAKVNLENTSDPFEITGKESLSWENLVDFLYDEQRKREPK